MSEIIIYDKENNYWNFLAKDILFSIGKLLSIENLWRCRRVCKKWNEHILSFNTENLMPILTGMKECTNLYLTQSKHLIFNNPEYTKTIIMESRFVSNEKFLSCKNKAMLEDESNGRITLGYVIKESSNFILEKSTFEHVPLFIYSSPISLGIEEYRGKQFCFFDRKSGKKSINFSYNGDNMKYIYRSDQFLIVFKQSESKKISIHRFNNNCSTNTWKDYKLTFDKYFKMNCTFNHDKEKFYIYDKSENIFYTLYPNGTMEFKNINSIDKVHFTTLIKILSTMKTCLIVLLKYDKMSLIDPISDETFEVFKFNSSICRISESVNNNYIELGNSYNIRYDKKMIYIYQNKIFYYMDKKLLKKRNFKLGNTLISDYCGFNTYGCITRMGQYSDRGYSLTQFDWEKYLESKIYLEKNEQKIVDLGEK